MEIAIRSILSVIVMVLSANGTLHAFVDRDLHTLNRDNGLGDNTINTITHDSDGFIWFGASGSLSRYDGQNVKIYGNRRKENGNAKSLYIDKLHAIGSTPYLIYDSGGRIGWFNRRTGKFLNGLHFPEDDTVSDIFEFDSCGIGIVTQTHILVIDTHSLYEHDGLLRFRIKRNLTMKKLSSTRLQKASASDGRVAVMDGKCNAYIFNAATPGKAMKRALLRDNYSSLNSVLLDGDHLMASTIGSGIIYHHIPSGRTISLNHDNPTGEGGTLSHSDVYDIVKTAPDEYTAATWNGYSVICLDKENPGRLTSSIYNFTTQQAMRNVENRMICAHRDANGILWLGTSGGGVLWTDVDNRFYGKYYQDRHNAIMSITVDRRGYVWLATYHKGILRSRQSLAENRAPDFVEVPHHGQSGTRTMLSSLEDSNGRLWFGNSRGELAIHETMPDRWSTVSLPKEVEINTLVQGPSGNILAGTSAGLYEVGTDNPTSRKITLKESSGEPLPDMDIRSLIAGSNGDLWIGTTVHGLIRLKNNGTLESGYEQSKGITAFDLRAMLPQGDSIIWAAYRSGLARFDVHGDSISEFMTTDNGLCSNIIGALAMDRGGTLWIGSNSGISSLDGGGRLRNFYISGSNSAAAVWDSMLLFGNNMSLTYFEPEKVMAGNPPYPIRINSLEVNNTVVGPGEKVNGQTILDSVGIEYADKIVLDHNNRNFKLDFSTMTPGQENPESEFRLLPYQQEWIASPHGEKVSYLNLPAGEYVFEIRLKGASDDDDGGITRLQIEIRRPWYLTLWFLLPALAAIISASALIAARIRRKRGSLAAEQPVPTVREHEPASPTSAAANTEEAAAGGPSADEEFMNRVHAAVRANFASEDFGVKSLAGEMNMSYSAFYRRLSAITDESAADIINRARVIEAGKLVAEGKLTLQQITERVGYADIRTLRKRFKEHFGMLPSAYRGTQG